jgi:hypothetical protein
LIALALLMSYPADQSRSARLGGSENQFSIQDFRAYKLVMARLVCSTPEALGLFVLWAVLLLPHPPVEARFATQFSLSVGEEYNDNNFFPSKGNMILLRKSFQHSRSLTSRMA